MSHRSADSLDRPTAWSADVSDDSVEFEEFAAANDASAENAGDSAGFADRFPEADTRPAWLRGRGSSEETTAGDTDEDTLDDSDADDMEFASLDTDAASAKDAADDAATESALVTRPRASRRRRRKAERTAPAPLIEVPDEEKPQLTWRAMLLAWVKDGGAGSYGTSVALHAVVGLLLAFVVKESLDKNQSISMVLTEADSSPIHFDEIEDISVDMAGGSEVQLPQFQNVPLSVNSVVSSDVASELMSLEGSGEGEGGDEGFGFKFKMPEGGKAVSAGSFSAWTVPEDPKPGQDYMIVIRIKAPERSRTYRITDLTGELVGTDGYRLTIPIDRSHPDKTVTEKAGRLVPVRTTDKLRVIKGHVQIMVKVPGAPSLVRDTIEVRSKMLKEEQKLEIVF